jgi:acyl-CoA thioesterase-2
VIGDKRGFCDGAQQGQVSMQALMRVLDLEILEHNLFRGISPDAGWQRVFGGQVIGQALMAACKTVDTDRHPHSLHGYFMRPGDPSIPIIYEVDRIRDGRSFTTRRIVAIQHGQAIFSMSCSFHIVEDDVFDHQSAMPDVPPPEELADESDMKATFMQVAPEPIRKYWERERPLELRPTSFEHYTSDEPQPAEQCVWLRSTAPVPEPFADDPRVHAAILAYASDMTLLDTALFPHGLSIFSRAIQAASLDHAMWFHRPFRIEDWLLYAQDAPSAHGARGFARGAIYNRAGNLVASTAQEGLIRPNKPKR